MFQAVRHFAPTMATWDAAEAHAEIREIVADTLSALDPEELGSMQTAGVCSDPDKLWAHVTRVGWWRSWCGG